MPEQRVLEADHAKYRNGNVCGTPGCNNEAGTFWSRWYCPACNAQRMHQNEVEIEADRARFATSKKSGA